MSYSSSRLSGSDAVASCRAGSFCNARRSPCSDRRTGPAQPHQAARAGRSQSPYHPLMVTRDVLLPVGHQNTLLANHRRVLVLFHCKGDIGRCVLASSVPAAGECMRPAWAFRRKQRRACQMPAPRPRSQPHLSCTTASPRTEKQVLARMLCPRLWVCCVLPSPGRPVSGDW